MIKLFVTFLIMLSNTFVALSAHATVQEISPVERLALADLTDELITCAVFYGIVGEGASSSGNKWETSAEKSLQISENLSLMAFNLGKMVNMKTETLLIKTQQATDLMGESINYDGINIGILIKKYGEACKFLNEYPEERFNYWLRKESE